MLKRDSHFFKQGTVSYMLLYGRWEVQCRLECCKSIVGFKCYFFKFDNFTPFTQHINVPFIQAQTRRHSFTGLEFCFIHKKEVLPVSFPFLCFHVQVTFILITYKPHKYWKSTIMERFELEGMLKIQLLNCYLNMILAKMRTWAWTSILLY